MIFSYIGNISYVSDDKVNIGVNKSYAGDAKSYYVSFVGNIKSKSYIDPSCANNKHSITYIHGNLANVART